MEGNDMKEHTGRRRERQLLDHILARYRTDPLWPKSSIALVEVVEAQEPDGDGNDRWIYRYVCCPLCGLGGPTDDRNGGGAHRHPGPTADQHPYSCLGPRGATCPNRGGNQVFLWPVEAASMLTPAEQERALPAEPLTAEETAARAFDLGLADSAGCSRVWSLYAPLWEAGDREVEEAKRRLRWACERRLGLNAA
jgi:hypothetical protein